MKTHPEAGDAIDHLDKDVELVVALNLCGFHGEANSIGVDNQYNKRNGELYRICTALEIPLVAVGSIPTLEPENPRLGVLYIAGGAWWPD